MHQIGVGVLGPVFRTYEPDEDRLVAVKAFHLDITPEQSRTLADALERLVGSGLSHPGLVSPIAAGLQDDVPYLAQEFATAESLDVGMRHYAPASPETALSFVSRIGEAIDAAHTQGVVHGALHLRDIFVTPDEARVTGFGVVRALEELRLAGPIRRPYTAPEVIAGRAWAGEADVFALAAVGYELLTGRRAAGTGEQVIARLRSLEGVADTDALQAVFATALADGPDDRFSSAARFVAALEAAVGQPAGEGARSLEDDESGTSGLVVPPVDLLAGLDIHADTPAALEFPAESDTMADASPVGDDSAVPADSPVTVDTDDIGGLSGGSPVGSDRTGIQAFDSEDEHRAASPDVPEDAEQSEEPEEKAGADEVLLDTKFDTEDAVFDDEDEDDDELVPDETEDDAEDSSGDEFGDNPPDAHEEDEDGEEEEDDKETDAADLDAAGDIGDVDALDAFGSDEEGDDLPDNDFHLEPEVTASAVPPDDTAAEPSTDWEPEQRDSSGERFSAEDLFDGDRADDSFGHPGAPTEPEGSPPEHGTRILPPEAYEFPDDDRPVWTRRPFLLLLLAVVVVGGLAYFTGGALSPDTEPGAEGDSAEASDGPAGGQGAQSQNARSTAPGDGALGEEEAGREVDSGAVNDPDVGLGAADRTGAAFDPTATAAGESTAAADRPAAAPPVVSTLPGADVATARRPLPAPARVDENGVPSAPARVLAPAEPVPLPSPDTNQSQGNSGWLLVRTVPVAAIVEVDGVSRGTTPLSVSDVGFGEHEVAVSHDGYDTVTQVVTFGPSNTVVSLGVELVPSGSVAPEIVPPAPGVEPSGPVAAVSVDSRPSGARIVVDGTPFGVTPAVVTLGFGTYELRLELDGYEPWAYEVTVTASEDIRIAASLERATR